MGVKGSKHFSSRTSKSYWVSPFLCTPQALCQTEVQFSQWVFLDDLSNGSRKQVVVSYLDKKRNFKKKHESNFKKKKIAGSRCVSSGSTSHFVMNWKKEYTWPVGSGLISSSSLNDSDEALINIKLNKPKRKEIYVLKENFIFWNWQFSTHQKYCHLVVKEFS